MTPGPASTTPDEDAPAPEAAGPACASQVMNNPSCPAPACQVRPRLTAIRDNLTARIAEAEQQGWLGEAEGLKVSLAAADTKLTQVDMLIARRDTAVSLGMPAFPDIAAQTATGRA